MEQLRTRKGFLCDMDGVIYKGNQLLPGVTEFVTWLYRENKEFLFLTNSSARTPRELQQKLGRMGLEVDERHFYTSALATAKFLSHQSPGCSAYVIGEPGLFNALHDAHITFNDDAISNTLELLNDIATAKAPFDGNLTGPRLRGKAASAFAKPIC